MFKIALLGLAVCSYLIALPLNSEYLQLGYSTIGVTPSDVSPDYSSSVNGTGPSVTLYIGAGGWRGTATLTSDFTTDPMLPVSVALTSLDITCLVDSCAPINFNFMAGFDLDPTTLDAAPYNFHLTGTGPDALIHVQILTADGYGFNSPNGFVSFGDSTYGNYNFGSAGFLAPSSGSTGNFDLTINGFFDIQGQGYGTEVTLPDSFQTNVGDPASVPEPATMPLAGLAFGIGLGARSWRRHRTVRG
jgi:hypothetical protein